MAEEEVQSTPLGEAHEVTMDSVVRTIIGKMFENDNDKAILEVTLEGTDSSPPPKVELEIRLLSINGTKTRKEEEDTTDG